VKKLNFGCGSRIANGWVNIDFYSADRRVERVNLLKGFPYPDNSFDVVYSSHVVEHFTLDQASFILQEAWRILKPGGIVRIVVPDLAETCKEYLRILALPDNDPEKGRKYDWSLLELLDQLVRAQAGGRMGPYLQAVMDGPDKEFAEYVRSRVQNTPLGVVVKHERCFEKLKRLSVHKVVSKITTLYLSCVKRLVPRDLRSMVFVETGIGERHRWMYDEYGLRVLFKQVGFGESRSLSFNETKIQGFNDDCLDCTPDGVSYKNNSIYLEAVK